MRGAGGALGASAYRAPAWRLKAEAAPPLASVCARLRAQVGSHRARRTAHCSPGCRACSTSQAPHRPNGLRERSSSHYENLIGVRVTSARSARGGAPRLRRG